MTADFQKCELKCSPFSGDVRVDRQRVCVNGPLRACVSTFDFFSFFHFLIAFLCHAENSRNAYYGRFSYNERKCILRASWIMSQSNTEDASSRQLDLNSVPAGRGERDQTRVVSRYVVP